jgi:hypothetical protein
MEKNKKIPLSAKNKATLDVIKKMADTPLIDIPKFEPKPEPKQEVKQEPKLEPKQEPKQEVKQEPSGLGKTFAFFLIVIILLLLFLRK